MTERIFLIGYMGSGKTTIGKLLAEKLNYSFIDIDHHIVEKTGKTVAQIFSEEGQDYFRQLENQILKELSSMEKVVISTGGGTPCFYNNMDIILSSGISFYLKWEVAHLKLRLLLDGIEKRPLLKGKSSSELTDFIKETLAIREVHYVTANNIIEGSDDVKMINEIIKILNLPVPLK